MDEEMCRLIDLSARLHDVGKFTGSRFDFAQTRSLHPGGARNHGTALRVRLEIIGQGGLGQLLLAQEIALNHHERWTELAIRIGFGVR